MDFVVPTNFVDLGQYRSTKIDFDYEAQLLQIALDSSKKENDIQQYIKNNQKWFIPGSLLRDYDFGHHDAYLVSEQALGAEYRADYLLLGSNSIGHHIVLVEFEDVNTEYKLTSENTEAHSVRKGLTQIRDWKRWIDNNEDNCSYTMERAETTLEDYILKNTLSDEIKINCIRQVLHILAEVHKMDIIHRDISPNNIFVISGMLKIADFGLGKDLKVFSSHQTLHTNALGQYFYCAPEQFMMLKDADKRSDVYSLGRVINFIMTGDPRNSHHVFRNVAEKATNSDAAYRYGDATQLSEFFEKAIEYQTRAENKEKTLMKIRSGQYDDAVENFIYSMSAESISQTLYKRLQGFQKALLTFMSSSENHAQHIIQSVEQSFRDVCGRTFEAYDPFAAFAHSVLDGKYSFVVKEIAGTILRFVAWDVNRFSAQHLVDDLISSGIDPMLEDIIRT